MAQFRLSHLFGLITTCALVLVIFVSVLAISENLQFLLIVVGFVFCVSLPVLLFRSKSPRVVSMVSGAIYCAIVSLIHSIRYPIIGLSTGSRIAHGVFWGCVFGYVIGALVYYCSGWICQLNSFTPVLEDDEVMSPNNRDVMHSEDGGELAKRRC